MPTIQRTTVVSSLIGAMLLWQNSTQLALHCFTAVEWETEGDTNGQLELEIEAPGIMLEVTVTDTSGNSTVATAQVEGLNPDNDDESDLDDD